MNDQFKQMPDAEVVPFECCKCGEEIIFGLSTPAEQIKQTLDEHQCQKGRAA